MNCLSVCLPVCRFGLSVCVCVCVCMRIIFSLFIEYYWGFSTGLQTFCLIQKSFFFFLMCNENLISGSKNLKRFSFIYSLESIIHHDIFHFLKSVFHLNLSLKYFSHLRFVCIFVVYLICMMRAAWKNVC